MKTILATSTALGLALLTVPALAQSGSNSGSNSGGALTGVAGTSNGGGSNGSSSGNGSSQSGMSANASSGSASGAQAGQTSQAQSQSAGAPLYISPAGVRQVQQTLNQLGYTAGNVDGQWGDTSQSALQAYEKAKGIEPVSELNPTALSALGLSGIMSLSGNGGQGAAATGNANGQVRLNEVANGPGAPLYATTATVRALQQALNQKGFTAGNVTGQWTNQTSNAVAMFQKAAGLEPTGNVDLDTLAALNLGSSVLGGGQGSSGGQSQGVPNSAPGQIRQQETARYQGTQIYVGPATLRQIQQKLNNDGYASGQVKGTWDSQLQKAVTDYQKARGLSPSGTLTTETLAALGAQQMIETAQASGSKAVQAGVRTNETSVGSGSGSSSGVGEASSGTGSGGASSGTASSK